MKRLIMILFCAALSISAQVKIVKSQLPLDGKLTGNGWDEVSGQSDFKGLKARGKTKPSAQTVFKVAVDRNNLYMSILCREDKMEKLQRSGRKDNLWSTDVVEVFFSPGGQPDEYYQFTVSSANVRYAMFYGEAGVIRPDPYLPFWESKVFYGKDHWLIQLKIPFSAFYLTRNAQWSSEWLMNVARSRKPVSELSSWSPLLNGFHESKNFRKFKGFPKRNPAQDVMIRKAVPVIRNFRGGVYSGPLVLTAEVNPAAAGEYELIVEEPEGKSSKHRITLKAGVRTVTVPKTEYLRKAQGKTELKLTLKSLKTGTVFGRSYPVDIVYEPVGIALTSPGYKRNFYPGQDHSRIAGKLRLRLSDEQKKSATVELSLSGGGLAKKMQKFKADRDTVAFSFDSKALKEGGKAMLTAKLIDGGREITSVSRTVTRLKKNAGSMVWIENGALVKNGKPWYPRHIYAMGYKGGKAFDARFRADNLAMTPFKLASVEPGRLIRGIEAKEATRDVKPSKALLEKVRQRVEKMRNRPDIDMYYICDEPECRHISPVYLKYIYDYVSELDPYHPLATCTREADRYLDCADVFPTHAYISPIVSGGKRLLSKPIHQVRNHLQDVTKFQRPDKTVGFTGQFFSYKFNNLLADYPTWEELESMSWSAIVQGSRFHYPYAYHDLGDRPQIYEGFRYLNQSIGALESLLLSSRKHPVKAVDPENMIDTLLVEDGNATLLIVVNLKNGPLKTVISAEHLKKFPSLFEFRGEGSRKIENGELKLAMKPYECVILTSKKLDKGLKSRTQVMQEVEAQNKARAARGSLLFEKEGTFEIDTSNPGGGVLGSRQSTLVKVCDGVIDMLAWTGNQSKPNWFELHFRKNPPKFSKIGVYGLFGGTPEVKIWKFGEWKKLVPKEVKTGKYSAVLDFGEELKSVKIHLDFKNDPKKKNVELYEIELLK